MMPLRESLGKPVTLGEGLQCTKGVEPLAVFCAAAHRWRRMDTGCRRERTGGMLGEVRAATAASRHAGALTMRWRQHGTLGPRGQTGAARLECMAASLRSGFPNRYSPKRTSRGSGGRGGVVHVADDTGIRGRGGTTHTGWHHRLGYTLVCSHATHVLPGRNRKQTSEWLQRSAGYSSADVMCECVGVGILRMTHGWLVNTLSQLGYPLSE